MICQDCCGIGEVLIDRAGRPVKRLRDATTMIQCPSCGGCGIAYCCAGDQACPDDTTERQP